MNLNKHLNKFAKVKIIHSMFSNYKLEINNKMIAENSLQSVESKYYISK